MIQTKKALKPGWHTLAHAGLALAMIRDGRLYRMKFDRFQAYCQAKCEYGRRSFDQMISAAQVFTQLRANCSHLQAERESCPHPSLVAPCAKRRTLCSR